MTPTASQTPCLVLTPVTEGFEEWHAGRVHLDRADLCPRRLRRSSVATAAHTGTRSAFLPDRPNITDQQMTLSNPFAIPSLATNATLSFWHRYGFEIIGASTYDGGVLEVSTNGGTTWNDAGANITSGGYTGTISPFFNNPLFGRRAWTGNSSGYPAFTQVTVNLLPYAGQNVPIPLPPGR